MVFGATSYKDTKFGIIARNKLIKLEIEGVIKGLKFVKNISKNRNIDITPELIKKFTKIHLVGYFQNGQVDLGLLM